MGIKDKKKTLKSFFKSSLNEHHKKKSHSTPGTQGDLDVTIAVIWNGHKIHSLKLYILCIIEPN